jgi:hypothetical protein
MVWILYKFKKYYESMLSHDAISHAWRGFEKKDMEI